MTKLTVFFLIAASTVGPGLAIAGRSDAQRSQAALRELTSTAGIRAAQRFARTRQGTVAFAVLDQRDGCAGWIAPCASTPPAS